jgi:hypothetical protein
MDIAILSGIARRVSRVVGLNEVGMDEFGNLRMDQYLPRYAQLAKQRRIFAANTGAGTAVAPVAAPPTTTATWGLFNGEDPGGKSYALLMVTATSISGTLGLGMSLLGTVAVAAVTGTKPTAYASSHFSSLSGGVGGGSKAVFAAAVTMVGTPAWVTLASRDQASAVSVGSGLVANLEGMLIVPPQFVGAATVLAPLGTTALFSVGFVWAEVELDLE